MELITGISRKNRIASTAYFLNNRLMNYVPRLHIRQAFSVRFGVALLYEFSLFVCVLDSADKMYLDSGFRRSYSHRSPFMVNKVDYLHYCESTVELKEGIYKFICYERIWF